METLSQIIKTKPDLISSLKKGEIIEARFIEKNLRAAFFEIPKISTGIIYGKELLNAKNIIKSLKQGDVINAKIVNTENDEGYIELSLTEIDKQKSWLTLKEIQEKDESIKIKITSINKGGLMGPLYDLNAFLPLSQLSTEHYPKISDQNQEKILEELNKFIGQELEVKIINLNPKTNKLIVSEKEILNKDIKELIQQYKVGDITVGIVSGLANFGAFIRFADNPEIEGLIHISELSHGLIDSPKDIISVGDTVKAKIVDIKNNKISLSLKVFQADPWKDIEQQYKVGDKVKGEIYKFNPFGAFIKLSKEIIGLIHISEFGGPEEMRSQIELGKNYDFVIDSLKAEEKRIILKLVKNA